MNCLQSDSKPAWVFGYTTREHLLLDLDNTSYIKVRYLIDLIMQDYPYVGDCIILLSSQPEYLEKWNYPFLEQPKHITKRHNYHAVFNNIIEYEKACHIIEILAELDAVNHDYVNIRTMRQDMTLRTSKIVNVEHVKPRPVFIEYIQNPYCKTDGQGIFLYNKLRKLCNLLDI